MKEKVSFCCFWTIARQQGPPFLLTEPSSNGEGSVSLETHLHIRPTRFIRSRRWRRAAPRPPLCSPLETRTDGCDTATHQQRRTLTENKTIFFSLWFLSEFLFYFFYLYFSASFAFVLLTPELMDMYSSTLSPALDIGTGCYLLAIGKTRASLCWWYNVLLSRSPCDWKRQWEMCAWNIFCPARCKRRVIIKRRNKTSKKCR